MSPHVKRYRTTTAPIAAVAVISLLASATGRAPARGFAQGVQTDSAAVVAVVDRYHQALSDGDTATVLSLLANDAMILESGDIETRDEYRSHHLPADIQFARAVPSVRGPVHVLKQGDAAWAISTSKTQGVYQGRTVASQGAELMVLTKEVHHWKIRVIHWSSRAIRPLR